MYFFDIDKFHFNCDGIYNGKQSWLSDDSDIKIIWDTTLTPNCWRFSSTTLYWLETVINTNPASPPINGNWNWVGRNYRIDANEGECAEVEELSMIITKTDPSCECNANLTVYGQGGQPPYMYSFDNGVTYVNSPFKNGLCGDLSLTVKIRDTLNNIASQLVQIPAQQPSTSYQLRIISTNRQQVTSRITRQSLTVTTEPALPAGVTITFDLNLMGVFRCSPYTNSANSVYTPLVKKNGTTMTYTDNTTNSQTPRSDSPCQNLVFHNTNYQYTYNLTYSLGDVYEISYDYGYTLTCDNPPPATLEIPLTIDLEDYTVSCCGADFNQLTHGVSGMVINGCSCCTVNSWEYFYNRS